MADEVGRLEVGPKMQALADESELYCVSEGTTAKEVAGVEPKIN